MTYAARRKRSQYRPLGLVGHGQFGRVFCAINRQTGELVALKDIPRNRLSTHKFLRELRFLLSLEHTHIATCQALEHSDTGRQLVLDYCEGGTLRYLLDAEVPLTVREVLDFLIQILAALEHAHSQGIVHCDIKPENILLTVVPGGWHIKISDFGIARLKREAQLDSTGHTGSPAYMAPERFYNQYSVASDLYAVGVIFYELLLGMRPFSGTPLELMVAHLNRYPDIPETLPEALRPVLRKGLEKLLARRYRTAADMRLTLLNLRQSLSEAGSYSLAYQRPMPALSADLPVVTLPHPVEVLGVINLWPESPTDPTPKQILVACQQQHIWFYHWRGAQRAVGGASQGFALRSHIRAFHPTPTGGCFVTDQSMHLLTMGQGLITVARFQHPVTATLSPNAQWLAAYQPAEPPLLLLRRLPRRPDGTVTVGPLQTVPLPFVPERLVSLTAIDSRHLLLVTGHGQTTHLRVYSRKGHPIAHLTLGVAIQSLVATATPYQYLATEVGYPNHVFRLDLKPFRIFRYRLDVDVHWLLATTAGHWILSHQGQLRQIDDEGRIVGHLDGLPQAHQVIPIGATQCLIATTTPEPDQRHQIYTLNLKNLGLNDHTGAH